MTTELSAPVDSAQLLRTKLQAEFIALIPAEKWDALINDSWDNLTKPVVNRYGPNEKS